MPSLNFTVFMDKVTDGTKPHSIRALRKVPFKAGDDLSFFHGMRTRACRRLRANSDCTAAVPISIFSNRRVVLGAGSRFYPAGGLDRAMIEALAQRDGFASTDAFLDFFIAQIPAGDREFRGQLVEWDPFAPPAGATPENGERKGRARNAAVYPATRAPLSTVRSRPAAAGNREPRGRCMCAGCSATTPGAKKPGRNFLP